MHRAASVLHCRFALDAAAGSTAAAQSMSHAYDIKARKHALHTVRAWAAKGYQPIYLSGRQGSYYNLTLGEGSLACVNRVSGPTSGSSFEVPWLYLHWTAELQCRALPQCCMAASGPGMLHPSVHCGCVWARHAASLPASGLGSSRSGSGPCCLTVAPALGRSAVGRTCSGQLLGFISGMAAEWLIRHQYPPGPIHLTRTHLPTLPIYVSVGNFKVSMLDGSSAAEQPVRRQHWIAVRLELYLLLVRNLV